MRFLLSLAFILTLAGLAGAQVITQKFHLAFGAAQIGENPKSVYGAGNGFGWAVDYGMTVRNCGLGLEIQTSNHAVDEGILAGNLSGTSAKSDDWAVQFYTPKVILELPFRKFHIGLDLKMGLVWLQRPEITVQNNAGTYQSYEGWGIGRAAGAGLRIEYFPWQHLGIGLSTSHMQGRTNLTYNHYTSDGLGSSSGTDTQRTKIYMGLTALNLIYKL
jgi:hypothetical protein